MATDRIDSIISEKAFAEVERLSAELKKNQADLIAATDEAIKYSAAIGKSGTFKNMEAEAGKAAIAIEKINQAQARTQILNENLATATAKRAAIEQQIAAKQEAAIAKQQAAASKKRKTIISDSQAEVDAANRASKGQDNLTDAINKTNRARAKEANDATAYGAKKDQAQKREQVNYKQTIGLIEKLNARLVVLKDAQLFEKDETRLKAINKTIQDTQIQVDQLGNVGKKGFDQFGNAVKNNGSYINQAWGFVRQLAYALPGVGIAGVVGFAVEPVLKYVASLKIFEKQINDILAARKQVNAATLKGQQDAQKELVTADALYRASQNTKLDIKERKEAINQLQALYPKYLGNISDEAILLGKASDKYGQLRQSIIATAIARAQEDKIAQAAGEKIELEFKRSVARQRELRLEREKAALLAKASPQSVNGLGVSGTDPNRVAAALREEQIKQAQQEQVTLTRQINVNKAIQVGLEKQIDAAVSKNGVKILGDPSAKPGTTPVSTVAKDALTEQQRILEGQIEADKAIVYDEKQTFEARLSFLIDYTAKQKLLNENLAQQQVQGKKITEQKLHAIQLDRINKDEAADRENLEVKKKINQLATKQLQDAQKDLLKAFEDGEKEQVATLKAGADDRAVIIEQERSQAIDALELQYAQGLISTKQYNQQKYDIEAKAARDTIQAQIDAVKQIIDLQKILLESGIGNALDIAASEKALAALQIKLSKEVSDKKVKDAKDAAEKIKAIRGAEKQLAYEVANVAIALIDGQYTKQKNAIQDQIDLIDVQKQREIDSVNSLILSNQEKANRIAIIDAQAQARKEVLQQRQRRIDVEKAKFDRLVSIARVVALTAEAVARDLLGNKFLIPFDIATGAAQIAAILATPLPKFKDGGKMKKDGLARFSEGGKQELRIDPDGKISLTPDRETVDFVKKDTRFISNKDLVQMLARPDQIQYAGGQAIDMADVIAATKESKNEIVKAIREKNRGGFGGLRYYDTPKGRSYMNKNLN